jgi:hypothetical protein
MSCSPDEPTPAASSERRASAEPKSDPDAHTGAIEGDRPEDDQQGNPNAPAVDSEGLPANPTAVAEDRVGANVDGRGEVATADETGRTSDAPRDELKPLE